MSRNWRIFFVKFINSSMGINKTRRKSDGSDDITKVKEIYAFLIWGILETGTAMIAVSTISGIMYSPL